VARNAGLINSLLEKRRLPLTRDFNKGLSPKSKARTKDHNFVLEENQGPRPMTTSLLIGRNMDDSSVVWKYVRPVDSVRTAVAPRTGPMT